MKLSIIIPVYNEIATIEEIVKKAASAKLPHGWTREIIVVDDHSHDGTRAVLERIEGLRIIYSPENGGKGAALKAGLREAAGDYVLIQDADLEYDPSDYAALLAPIAAGTAKVVFGSRRLGENKVPLSRIYFYGGVLVTKLYNALFGTKLTDVATCYKVFPAAYAAELARLPSDDFVFDVVELTHFLSQREKIVEVPISYASRPNAEGKKLSWVHGVRSVAKMIGLFSVSFANRRSWTPVVLALALFFGVFFYIYFSVSTLSSGDDHFFHFRFAQQMLSNGFFHSFQDFKSIYYSKMAQGNSYFMYYNFLFYLVLLPFAYISPLFIAIKLYAVIAAAAAFTLLYWCLRRFEVKNAFVWTLAMIAITNVDSIWRFFLSRPYALAPSLLLLLLYFLYRKNNWGVIIVSFVYLFWHSSTFFMPAGVATVYWAIEWFYEGRPDYRGIASAYLGTALAVASTYLVSSGFILFIWDTLVKIYFDTILGKKVILPEGTELYPVDFFNFIQDNALIFAAFVTALSVDISSYVNFRRRVSRKLSAHEDSQPVANDYYGDVPRARRHLQGAVLVLTAVFFLGTVAASARFGDYFTFFAALYIALSFDYARRLISFSGPKIIRESLAVALMIVLAYLFASNMLFLENKLARGQSLVEFYQVGSWLERNSKPGDIVYESNWSWFPQLYYWSPKDYYMEGLEPRFTYDYDKALYWNAYHISVDGYVCETASCPDRAEAERAAFQNGTTTVAWAKTEGDKIAAAMRDQFHATYIVTTKSRQVFDYILTQNKNFTLEIYDSTFGNMLFKVNPPTKGGE